MAADAVDAAVAEARFQVPRVRDGDTCPCSGPVLSGRCGKAGPTLADDHGVSVEQAEHLLRRYGGLAPEVIGLGRLPPPSGRAGPRGGRYLKAEVEYAVTHEGALHLEDVLVRRTRIAMETPRRGHGQRRGGGQDNGGRSWAGTTPEQAAEVADYSRQAQLVGRSASTAQDDSEAARLARSSA